MEHADYPHTPGTLPDCPACDLEFARQAYVQSSRGLTCPNDAMEMLGQHGKRLVEAALTADRVARENDIPVRDALHRLNFGDRVKATVAEWVCPDAVDDWTGSIEHRMTARQRSDDRARERVNDDVLAICADLNPNDWSLEARQVRETAASIRDHRANALNRRAHEARKRESELLDQARAQFAVRDENIEKGDEAYANGQMGWVATYRDRAQEAHKAGSDLVSQAIAAVQELKQAELAMSLLLQENSRYDDEKRRRAEA